MTGFGIGVAIVLGALLLFCVFGLYMSITAGIECGERGGRMTRDFGCVSLSPDGAVRFR